MNAVQLVVPPDLVAHVAVALEHHLHRCREQAVTVPPSLVELRDWAVVVQRGLSSPDPLPPSDDAPVVGVLLRLPEVAERLSCSLTSVKRLIAAGDLPVVHLLGQRRVRTTDLDAFVESLDGGTFRDRVEVKETG